VYVNRELEEMARVDERGEGQRRKREGKREEGSEKGGEEWGGEGRGLRMGGGGKSDARKPKKLRHRYPYTGNGRWCVSVKFAGNSTHIFIT